MSKNTINKFFIVLLIFFVFLFPVNSSATANNETREFLGIIKNPIKVAVDAEADEQTDDNFDEENNDDIENEIIQDDDTELDTSTDENLENENSKYGDIYLSGTSINIDYSVDGNLFVVGQDVTINSQIVGDAFIMADSLTIGEDAYIYNNLFSFSNKLDVKGTVYQMYSFAKDADIVSAYIDRDLRISCNNLNLQSDIGRNALINCKSLTLENQEEDSYATIGGDLIYSAKDELENIPEYIVTGETKFTSNILNNIGTPNYIISAITALCFASLVWLCLLWLSPKFLSSSSKLVKEKKGLIAITSICTLILVPIVSILFTMTNILSSFAILLMALYCILIALGSIISTIVISNFICDKFNINKKVAIWGILLLVRLVLWTITLIPFVGGIISFIITLLGMGIILTYILPFNNFNKKNKSVISETF